MLKKVAELIEKTLKRNDITLTESTDLIKDLELNSLDLAELISAFEDEFDIEIPERDVVNFRVVKNIVAYLERINQAK